MFSTVIGAGLIADGITNHHGLETALGAVVLVNGHATHSKTNQSYQYTVRRAETKLEKQTRLAREHKRIENEDQQELERLKIFKAHLAFIPVAMKLSSAELVAQIKKLPPLAHPIERFSKSIDQGLPHSEGNNLYEIIFTRSDLTDSEKMGAVIDLINLGYPANKIDLVEHLLALNDAANGLLFKIYTHYNVPYALEIKIWDKLLHSSENYAREILHHLNDKLSKTVSFVAHWINSKDSIKDIFAIDIFLKELTIRTRSAFDYQTHFNQLTEHRVLSLELEKTLKSVVAKEKKSEINPIAKNPEITAFLASHRSTLCCFTGKTPGQKIYDAIVQNKIADAKRDIFTEHGKMEQQLIKQHLKR